MSRKAKLPPQSTANTAPMPYEPSSTPSHPQEASRMPMTPAKSEVEKGPYRSVPAHNTPRTGGLTPLQKHSAFFDRYPAAGVRAVADRSIGTTTGS